MGQEIRAADKSAIGGREVKDGGGSWRRFIAGHARRTTALNDGLPGRLNGRYLAERTRQDERLRRPDNGRGGRCGQITRGVVCQGNLNLCRPAALPYTSALCGRSKLRPAPDSLFPRGPSIAAHGRSFGPPGGISTLKRHFINKPLAQKLVAKRKIARGTDGSGLSASSRRTNRPACARHDFPFRLILPH
ncbi:Hypothetical protein NTJ_08567 [Nesidiocoris tenuis]|uniref:Uncharacterized protein n=1 Tax=Nesidiocoris tenuis TaxID=355587 RepID=A0ABN7AU78_9HEMI|nr:Hypothetical protein NTJ_08567 [Nesidiocoris tenuis]